MFSISYPAPSKVDCLFRYSTAGETVELSVKVATMVKPDLEFDAYRTLCELDKKPMAAIGNETWTCPVQSTSLRGRMAVGRVRSRAFIIVLSTTAADSQTLPPSRLMEQTQMVAELVAGNLF